MNRVIMPSTISRFTENDRCFLLISMFSVLIVELSGRNYAHIRAYSTLHTTITVIAPFHYSDIVAIIQSTYQR